MLILTQYFNHVQLCESVHSAAITMFGSVRPATMLCNNWRGGLQDSGQEAKLIKDALRVRPQNQCCSLDRLHSVIFLQDNVIDFGELKSMRQAQAHNACTYYNGLERLGSCCVCVRHITVPWSYRGEL